MHIAWPAVLARTRWEATPFTLISLLARRMAQPASASDITPVALDMRCPDEHLRRTARAALENTLTPMLSLHHHGCSEQLAELAARARAHHSLDGGSLPPQSACDFDGPLEPLARDTSAKLTALCTRLLKILAGDTAPALEGRLCMRTYPQAAAHEDGATLRLGAHLDNTLFTLLWSDSPGLQVLHPERAREWTPERVLRYGLPTLGDADEAVALREDQWATVQLPWDEGPLLLTLGCAWLSSPLPTAAPRAQCAVLHRVVAPPRDRHSIPFLVDLKSGQHGESA